jgi:hypothetical protein
MPSPRSSILSWTEIGVLMAATFASQTNAFASDNRSPVVVELFQSQGCSSCPPANANVNALSSRSDILALSFSVTYWDSLGWKDTFAKNEFTARQYAYARSVPGEVYTPQVVVNGRVEGVGADRGELDALVSRAPRVTGGPAIAFADGRVSVGPAAAASSPAVVWLVRFDPRTIEVSVLRGENAGRTLPHRNIVHELVRLGAWSGQSADFALPAASDPAWSTAILVQSGGNGPILSAAEK